MNKIILLFLFITSLVDPNSLHAQLCSDSLKNIYSNKNISPDTLVEEFLQNNEHLPDTILADCFKYLNSIRKDLSSTMILKLAKDQLVHSPPSNQPEILKSAIKELHSKSSIDTLSLAYAMNTIGEFYAKNSQNTKALEYFIQVVELFPKDSKEEELGYTYNNLGTILSRQNDPGGAIPYIKRSMDIFSHHLGSEHLYISIMQNNLGMAYGEINNHNKQLEYLIGSENIRLKHLSLSHPLMFEIKNNLAITYSALKQHDKAEAYMLAALSSLKEAPNLDKVKYIHGLSEITIIRHSNSIKYSHNKIQNFYLQAIQESELLLGKEHEALKNIYNNYAVFCSDYIQNPEKSSKYFQKAINVSSSFPNRDVFLLPAFNNLSDISLNSLLLFSNYGNSLYNLYLNSKEHKYLDHSIKTFQLCDSIANALKPRILNTHSRKNLKEQCRHTYTFACNTIIELYSITGKREYLELLYAYVEKINNWELLERYSFTARVKNIKDSHLARQIDSIKNNLSFNNQIETDHALTQHLDLLMQKLKLNHPDYYQQLYGNFVIPLVDLQAYCKNNNSQWLIYFMTSSTSFGILCVGADTVYLHTEQNNLQEIASSKSAILDKIQNKSWDYIVPAHNLYIHLFDPIRKHISTDKIIVSGFITMIGIPFEMLVSNFSNDENPDPKSIKYLLEDYIFSYMHSSSFGYQINKNRIPINNPAYFAPEYLRKNELLRYNDEEILNAHNHIGGTIYKQKKASEENFIQSLDQNDLIHFAGHIYSQKNIDSIYLLMNGGSDSLFLSEIFHSRSGAELIVLSGCESALGQDSPEAIIGPAYGFTFAGTPNIISSLWKVEDQSSSQLFNLFYKRFSEKKGSVESLTLAKRDYIDNSPLPSKHPYYWASNIYFGNEVFLANSSAISLYMLVGFVFLIGIILLFWKKIKS